MELHPNEMVLIFDNESSTHRKTRALAKSITKHINECSLRHNKLSKLRWAKIIMMLNLRPKDLLNKAEPKYQQMIAGHDFDDDDWLEIIRENTDLLKGPIAIMNGKAILCVKPKDIYKLIPDHVMHQETNE